MNITQRHKEIPKENWLSESQKMELEIWKNSSQHEDRNSWWKTNFNNYEDIKNIPVQSLLEVGCGPFAQNTRHIMEVLNQKPSNVFLNDPLLTDYIKLNKPVCQVIKELNAAIYPYPLEECHMVPVDMIICINVLDHVFSMPRCLDIIYNGLNPNGILIFGNDLTNEDNFNRTPKEDPYGMLHPIRFDHTDIQSFLVKFEKIYEKTVPVNGYHCGTLCFIGAKNG